MKYFVLIGDGMSDLPIKELGGKTPLDSAKTPNMDFIAKNGESGLVLNVPPTLTPGSDVAAMSIFGYNPTEHYTGRGPLEASSLGVKLKTGDIAFRCNFVTIRDGIMESFTADHISTPEASKLINTLNKKLGGKYIKFYTGLSYRHLLVISQKAGDFVKALGQMPCTPPHDITGKDFEKYLPKGEGSDLIKGLMKESVMHMLEHPVNINRIRKGRKPATMIWLWGNGEAPKFISFKKKFKKRGAIITAVHLLKGLGRTLGMEVVNVKGATGFLDTNYNGKANGAIKASKKNDVIFVHVEAPDECGHMGDIKGKIKAIEDFDRKIVGPILKYVNGLKEGGKVLVLPDHPTPIAKMTHTRDYVPFTVYNSKQKKVAKVKGYSESEAKKSRIKVDDGSHLIAEHLFD